MITNKPSQLFLVILVVSLLGACGQSDPKANAGKPPAAKVKLMQVQSATVSDSSEFIGSLESRRSVTLQPQIAGQVSRIFARYGDQVPQGKVIIQIDPSIPQASLNSSRAAAEAAQADVQNARATLSSLQAQRLANVSAVTYNQKQYARYVFLSGQGAVPVQNRDQYAENIQQAQANLSAINKQIQAQQAAVAKAEKTLKQAGANTQQQQAQLANFTIAAPFAGTVGDIPVKVGDFVNTSTQLVSITQNQPLEVNISIPIERAPQLRLGMPVELLDNQGQTVGTSQVFFISPNVNNNTQSVLIKSLFDNSRNQLRASQYVHAKVIWDRHPGVLIPTTAVSRIGGQTFIYVAQTQQKQAQPGQPQQNESQLVARQKPVKLGDIEGNNYQVTEGLQPGDKVITSGILTLSDGSAISPES